MAAPEMSSARSRLRMTRCRCSNDAGASVKPQCPMTTVVTPCQHEDVPSGSQNTCASMCVWPSMKPGVTTLSVASISSRPASVIRPILAMRPALMPTSALYGVRPVPSTTVPPRMTMSYRSLLSVDSVDTAHLDRDPVDCGVAGRHIDEMPGCQQIAVGPRGFTRDALPGAGLVVAPSVRQAHAPLDDLAAPLAHTLSQTRLGGDPDRSAVRN